MQVSIVIPAFNEGAKIAKDVESTVDFLKGTPYFSELLIVDDGSRDDTYASACAAAKKYGSDRVKVRVLNYGMNRGKGYAIRHGMGEAVGEVVGFMDSGLCVPLRFVPVAVERIQGGADFAIASRRLPGTKITKAQPLHRRVGSKVFWHIMRLGMGVNVTDTQCGFKFFSQAASRKIFPRLRTDGFMFDIEALLVAKKLGLRGVEFPVEWSNDSDSRYRLVSGTIRNMKEIARIRMRLSREGVTA